MTIYCYDISLRHPAGYSLNVSQNAKDAADAIAVALGRFAGATLESCDCRGLASPDDDRPMFSWRGRSISTYSREEVEDIVRELHDTLQDTNAEMARRVRVLTGGESE